MNPELLEIAHKKLYWPEPKQILEPSGAGPSIYARLAQEKIGKTIEREFPDARGLNVGVLTSKPSCNETEAPIAIVCAFERPLSQEALKKTHSLAWSFSRSQALVTIEPHLLRVWTCCEAPNSKDTHDRLEPITTVSKEDILSIGHSPSQEQQAAETLYWVELITGRFFEKNQDRFKKSQAADQQLLANLKSVRRQLADSRLDEDIVHDLLARLIFIQFLFHRKDSSGKPALDGNFLQNLFYEKILSAEYRGLSDILSNHRDTYALFRLLNDRFNGDLFPGKGATETERTREWEYEEQKVTHRHLNLLADFVGGSLVMDNGQTCLWPLYSFDAVPLDFISSIYEEFVSDNAAATGAHYTPGHVVDFILDNVLPWNDPNWNMKILDPACGSGIFLVKAFQRILHRWKYAHPGEEMKAKDIGSILENNMFGVDTNQHAVRVASFSLYLTMCDEIDPRQYWKTVRFPKLRTRNLIHGDFFQEDIRGIRTDKDAGTYDVVIGNAPWGRNSAKQPALKWAKENDWPITYGNVGPVFLPKAASLIKSNGQVAMMQPALILLLSQRTSAKLFREKLFSRYSINEVVNLSALRNGLFKNSISPSCIIIFTGYNTGTDSFIYKCPKPTLSNEDDYRIIIENGDINEVNIQEVINMPALWTVLMWGTRRDTILIKKLSRFQSLAKLEKSEALKTRQGIIRTDRKQCQPVIIGRRILEAEKFPQNTFLFLNAQNLQKNDDPLTHSRDSTDYSAFELPQLILKQRFQQDSKRFEARLVQSEEKRGILCSTGYVSVHAAEEFVQFLEMACLTFNSKLAVYYLLLTSSSVSSDRPKAYVEELLSLPLPVQQPCKIENIKSFDFLDSCIYNAFALKDSERILIEDLYNYTFPDYKGNSQSPGRQPTRQRKHGSSEHTLISYCEYFIKVLKAGFGRDKQVSATIFQQDESNCLPIRLVAFYLGKTASDDEIRIERIQSAQLMETLHSLNNSLLHQNNESGIFYQRVARIYSSAKVNGRIIPAIYLLKPDKIRYWTRSMAIYDADSVSGDIMLSKRG